MSHVSRIGITLWFDDESRDLLSISLVSILMQVQRKRVPLKIVKGFLSAFQIQHQSEYTLLIRAGHVFKSNRWYDELVQFTDQRVPAIGHIIARPGEALSLHPQLMLFMTHHLTSIAAAVISCKSYRLFERSDNNIHDDYTPLWVRSTQAPQERADSKVCESIAAGALELNREILNWPWSYRRLKHDISTDTPLHRAEHVNRYIYEIERQRSLLYPFNNEPHVELELPTLAHVMGVASGLKLNALTHRSINDKTRFTFFDISRLSLEFRGRINNDWDGKDYESYASGIASGYDASLVYISAFRSSRQVEWLASPTFVEHWRLFKELPKQYIRHDIVGHERKKILAHLKKEPSFIWFSNSFTSQSAVFMKSFGQLCELYLRFSSEVSALNEDSLLFGYSPLGEAMSKPMTPREMIESFSFDHALFIRSVCVGGTPKELIFEGTDS